MNSCKPRFHMPKLFETYDSQFYLLIFLAKRILTSPQKAQTLKTDCLVWLNNPSLRVGFTWAHAPLDSLWCALQLILPQQRGPLMERPYLDSDFQKGSTLVISLCGLWDADSELAAVRVDTHHATVSWGAGESWNLAGVPGDTVQGFGNVCSTL